jgi:hypothetical protein
MVVQKMDIVEHTSILQEEWLRYLADYIAHGYRTNYPALDTLRSRSFESKLQVPYQIHFISRGKCLYRLKKLQETASIANRELRKYHGNTS